MCKTTGCINSKKQGSYCYACAKMRWAKKNPARYAYNNLRGNARRRGKEFELTFEEFQQFCIKTKYLNGKGRSATGLHIDRINPKLGYTKDNIQVLTNRENVQKYIRWNGRGMEGKDEFKMVIVYEQSPDTTGCPF